jgi:hypothetical protein
MRLYFSWVCVLAVSGTAKNPLGGDKGGRFVAAMTNAAQQIEDWISRMN